MKRKPGAPRRRDDDNDNAAEIRAWGMAFKTGHDYANRLKSLGLGGYQRGCIKRAPGGLGSVVDQEFIAAAREAWARIGRKWAEKVGPDGRKGAWAASEFGPPKGMTLADFDLEEDEEDSQVRQ